MPADTPTLNRAANQIQSVGAARLSLDDVRALAAELGGRPTTTYGILAIRLSRKLDTPIYYYGCAENTGKKAGERYRFLFGPDSKRRVRVRGRRRESATTDHGTVPGAPTAQDILDIEDRADSGDGAPA